MNTDRIIAARMDRQALLAPVSGEAYDALFQNMSPVHTLYWTEPGAPPVLQRRAAFDDWEYNHRRRAERKILKGRYQNGSVGYVDACDLELYACAYRKSIPSLNFEELALLDLLTREGPLTIGTIKDITGLLVKKITPVLHKLQQAFLVFEDQIDCEGDRAWYAFESEFPEIDLNRYTRVEAIAQIIMRFLSLAVCADADAVKSFYGFTVKEVNEAMTKLLTEGAIQAVTVGNSSRPHYCRCEDEALCTESGVSSQGDGPVPRGVFLLHRSDFWVKSEEHTLKKRFSYDGADVLYYITVDGILRGAVMGRFKFGPHVIEDVQVDLPEHEKTARREEILQAVYEIFDREASPVQRYDGQPLNTRA